MENKNDCLAPEVSHDSDVCAGVQDLIGELVKTKEMNINVSDKDALDFIFNLVQF